MDTRDAAPADDSLDGRLPHSAHAATDAAATHATTDASAHAPSRGAHDVARDVSSSVASSVTSGVTSDDARGVADDATSESAWRHELLARLRSSGHGAAIVPVDGGAPVGAAELAARAAAWTRWLDAHAVEPGDRVVCALPPGPAFVALLVAALDRALTFVPVAPGEAPAAALVAVDARLAVVPPGPHAAMATTAGALVPCEADGAPPADRHTLRARRGAPTREARFLLRTSGTTGRARRIALSDRNLHAVLASHGAHLARAGATGLSVLPWHHAFGLVLELLPALHAGSTLVREPSGGRDVPGLLAAARAHAVTHLCAVPHTLQRLAAHDDGRALLAALRGGLVGGAPVDAALAQVLATTRLQVGYGQTEASPGITLGAPGAWRAATLGRPLDHPLACQVRIDADGMLAFRGPNACLGEWHDGAEDEEGDGANHGAGRLVPLAPDRWVRTGDLVRQEADGSYTFEGRAADSFKLANGRWLAAAEVERAVHARWPHVGEALLSSPDGHALVLAASTHEPGASLPTPEEVAPLLGPLATRPLRVVRVAPDAWARTPKGELDRRFPVGRPTPGATDG